MKQIKTASLTALSHFTRLLVMLLILKQIALVYGPEGLGFLGNYMSLMTIAGSLAGGGVFSGIIKYISEYNGRPFRQMSFVGSAFLYSLLIALFTLVVGCVFIKPLTQLIFLSIDGKAYIYFFLVFGSLHLTFEMPPHSLNLS